MSITQIKELINKEKKALISAIYALCDDHVQGTAKIELENAIYLEYDTVRELYYQNGTIMYQWDGYVSKLNIEDLVELYTGLVEEFNN